MTEKVGAVLVVGGGISGMQSSLDLAVRFWAIELVIVGFGLKLPPTAFDHPC